MPDSKLAFAKQLRQTMTDAERLLWYHLRRHHLAAKFRRQQPIGRYVVDFVCFEHKLVLEVDGAHHLESASDEHRDAWLRGQGFEILRFWNNQVLQETEAVLEKIYGVLTPTLSPSPQPLPHQGGGANAGRAGAAAPAPQPLLHHGRGVN